MIAVACADQRREIARAQGHEARDVRPLQTRQRFQAGVSPAERLETPEHAGAFVLRKELTDAKLGRERAQVEQRRYRISGRQTQQILCCGLGTAEKIRPGHASHYSLTCGFATESRSDA